MKHMRSEAKGSQKRIYDKPATAFERLKRCGGVEPTQLERFEELKATLNSFALKRQIERQPASAPAAPRGRGPSKLAA